MSVGTSDTTVISSPNPEARNLNAIDASAAQRDDSSPAPKNRHGSAAGMTETDITNRLVLARQRRLLNLRTRIAQLEEELTALEECSGLQDDEYEVYVSKKRKQESLIKILEELLSKPIDSYIFTQGSLLINIPRRSAYSSQNLTTFNYNFKDSSCLTTTHAQEQVSLISRSASQADINTTYPLGQAVNPLDNITTTDFKWYTSGLSYSGSSPTITEGHIKSPYTGPTQDSMCVQQNSFTTTRNFTIPKSLPNTGTLHKRDINKNDFKSEPSKASLHVRLQLLHNDGSISDKTIPRSYSHVNVSHHYVAPVHPTYETSNNVTNVDVSMPFKRHQGHKLSLATRKSKITISEEGENDIYDVPSDFKEEKTVNDDDTSTKNGDDTTEHTRRYRKHEALRIKPDFHDVQLITDPGNSKKCPGTITAYCKDQNFIANSCDHNYATALTKHLRRPKEKLARWNDIFCYVVNQLNFCNTKYISNPYVAPDGKGCSYNGAYLLIRPSHCC